MKRSIPFLQMLITILAFIGYQKTNAQSFWSPVSGPYGGIVYSPLVAEDGTYYVGTAKADGIGGEIFRRSPGRNVWQKVMTTDVVLTLFQSADGALYAGTDNGAILMSTDGFKWDDVSTGLSINPSGDLTPTVRTIIQAPNGDILAGTSRGVYLKSFDIDNNIVWNRINGIDEYILALKVDVNNGFLYAACFSGVIFKSTDNGQTWTGISPSRLEVGYMDVIFDIAINGNGDVYAATYTGLFVNRFANNNNLWAPVAKSKIPTTVKIVKVIGTRVFINQQAGGALYSDDNGTTWKTTSLGALNVNGGFAYDATQNQVLAGSFNGIWTADNTTLAFKQIGLPENITFVNSFQPKAYVFVGNAALYETPDMGATWNKVFSTTEGIVTGYAAKPTGENFISEKVGISNVPAVSYQRAAGELRFDVGFPGDVQNIKDVLITHQDTVLVATDAGLYYINSKTFSSVKLSILGDKVMITSLKEDLLSDFLYAGTSDGIYISNDHGATWSIHLLSGIQVNDFAVSNTSEIFAATDIGLFYFSNANSAPFNPDPLGNLNPDQRFISVAVDDYGHIYTICDDGIYTADDFNSPWQLETDGADNFKYAKISILSNVAYLATDYGLFKHQPDGVAPALITGNTVVYDGKPHSVTISTQPANLPLTITYNNLSAIPVNAGKYTVKVMVNDPSYIGGASASLTISKAQQTITFASISDKTSTDKPFDLQASTSTQLPVTFTIVSGPASVAGKTLTLTGGVGVVNVKAQQAGDNNYLAALSINRNFEVSKGETDPDTGPVTGLEGDHNFNLSLYPIPASNEVVLESNASPLQTIKVMDVIGKTLKVLYPNASRCKIDVSNYPEGLFLFDITTEKVHTTKRVSIKR